MEQEEEGRTRGRGGRFIIGIGIDGPFGCLCLFKIRYMKASEVHPMTNDAEVGGRREAQDARRDARG